MEPYIGLKYDSRMLLQIHRPLLSMKIFCLIRSIHTTQVIINYGTGDITVFWNEILDQTVSDLIVANSVIRQVGLQFPEKMFLSNATNENY